MGGSQLEPHFGDHLFLTPWEGKGAALLHSYLVDVGEKGLVWEKGKNRIETGDLQEIKRKKKAYLNSWEFSGLKQYLLFVTSTLLVTKLLKAT